MAAARILRSSRWRECALAPLALVLALAALAAPASACARTIALLIGIGQFDGVGLTTEAEKARLSLEGPPLDIAAMRQVVEKQMGAQPEDIHVLLDHQASRANIRAELAALVPRSSPGDTVLIYYSGHGTSQRDPDSQTGLPQGTSAWIPADFDWANMNDIAGRLISGRLDIRPLALEPLDRGGRHVIIISDSCFSGNIARGIGHSQGDVINRYVPLGDGADLPAGIKDGDFVPPAYPYRNVLMLSASADTEKAADLARSRASLTVDGKPKGALTNALLRVFEGLAPADYDHDGKVSFVELRRAVLEDLAEKHLAQSPQLLPSLDQDPQGIIFGSVPGAPALTSARKADPLRVSIPSGSETLDAALRSFGEFALVAAGGDMAVTAGSAPGRYTLSNGSGDLVARDATAEAVVTRLRAAAWARQVIAAGEARITLAADTEPASRGGNFVIGRDSLQFAVKAGEPVWYLVLDIDPLGRLVTLWPTSTDEDRPAPAGAVQTFGRTAATDPEGLDRVIVLAFRSAPGAMANWYRLSSAFGSAEASGLAQWLAGHRHDYAAATIDVRTIADCAGKGTNPCAP